MEGHGQVPEPDVAKIFGDAGLVAFGVENFNAVDALRKELQKGAEDEAGVRTVLLKSLMEGTSAARAVRREVLRQAIVQTLIQDFTGSGEPESEPPKPRKSDRAAPRAST